MKKGICPKCDSKDVYVGTFQAFTCDGRAPHLEAYKGYEQNQLLLLPYVCTSCGYVEFYLNADGMQKIPVLIEDKVFWRRVA